MRIARLIAVAAVSAVALAGCMFGNTITAEVGECINTADLGTEIDNLPKVDCEELHDAEVIAVYDVEYSGTYNANDVFMAAAEQCFPHFEEFVGVAYDNSELDIFVVYPLAEGWSSGDKEAICMVQAIDWNTYEVIPVTGSLRGANR